MSNTALFEHIPVLLEPVVAALEGGSQDIYFDGTAGLLGHGRALIEKYNPKIYIAADRDKSALDYDREQMRDCNADILFINENYYNFTKILSDAGVEQVDRILLDLGVSSYQLSGNRGFSYHHDDDLLDMRMGSDCIRSAADIVNGYSERELLDMYRRYTDEKFAQRIVKGIITARAKGTIKTTGELNEIIGSSVPAAYRRQGNPCKKTYIALRCETNGELVGLADALGQMFEHLSVGGVMAVISFSALEDSIVRKTFKELKGYCKCTDSFSPVCTCGFDGPRAEIYKPVDPTPEEIELNSRSRSAKLRVLKKIK